jgi:hypothetical protein
LSERLSQFRESDDLKEDRTLKDLEARRRLSVLEERMQQSDREIGALRTELSRHLRTQGSASEALLGRVSRLEAEVSALQTAPALAHSIVPTAKPPPPSSPTSPLSTPPSVSVPPALPSSPGWNSAIVHDFPKLFEDFKQKQFTLLWRGSRDGFGVLDFHSRCDGHANTLTVILDTDGNVFGGFTPVEWESREWNGKYGRESNCPKADHSLKSFLFTLKNPHKFPAQTFALKAVWRKAAIGCNSDRGPHFNDITVRENCNANTDSFTCGFGRCYTNDTGLDGETFFTGSRTFQVKEIEVFEIIS